MASFAQSEDRGVSIGRVFARAFGTLRDNPAATLGIAFLCTALPSVAVLYATQNMQAIWAASAEPMARLAVIAVGIVSSLVSILLWMITQGALVRATVAFSEGRKASLGESVVAGLQVAVPLFLMGLLSGIGIALGAMLLIVPGMLLYVLWSVAAPSLVEERLGPVEALERSRELTSGARWPIFGLLLILLVAYLLVSVGFALIGLKSPAFGAPPALGSADIAMNLISSTVTPAVVGVVHTSLYVELREWKDGPRGEVLADIFA